MTMICSDCGKDLDIGDWPFACHGRGHDLGPFWRGDANVHSSDKVVIYENPATGDIRIPGRADRPMHPKYEAAGYQRKTLDTISQIREVEQKKNLIHEGLNYSTNSAQADKDTGSI